MARILAVDWDRLEARAVLLYSGPTGSSVAGACAVPLSSADGSPPTARQVGTQLGAAIAGSISGNVTTLIGVGREHVQMKLLSLPPAPAEELPELVRFQAEREFTALGDDAALDYIPLAGDAQTPNLVLAAVLARAGLGEVQEIGRALEVEADRVTLRAAGAASFVARSISAGDGRLTLVVNGLSDEADLAALAGDQVVLVRTVRLPRADQSTARRRALAGEIRRTIAAVRQQLSERGVGNVILCGSAGDTDAAAPLADDLALPVEPFDVAANAPAGLSDTSVPADAIARMAAVLGMALGEADRRRPVIDFLNVRRRAAKQTFTRLHALAAAAAAAGLLALGAWLWQQAAAPQRQLESINTELASLETQAQQYQPAIEQTDAIAGWLASDVNWLDELDRLSRQWRPEPLASDEFPADDDAVVTELTALAGQGSQQQGGLVNLAAVAKTPAIVAPLEQRLRDAARGVSSGGGKQDHTITGYGWSFGLRVEVPADEPADEASP